MARSFPNFYWISSSSGTENASIFREISLLSGADVLTDACYHYVNMNRLRLITDRLEALGKRVLQGSSRESGEGFGQDLRAVSLLMTGGKCAAVQPCSSDPQPALTHKLQCSCRWGEDQPFGHDPEAIFEAVSAWSEDFEALLCRGTQAEIDIPARTAFADGSAVIDAAIDEALQHMARRLYALRFYCRIMGYLPLGVRALGDCGGFLLGDQQCETGRLAAGPSDGRHAQGGGRGRGGAGGYAQGCSSTHRAAPLRLGRLARQENRNPTSNCAMAAALGTHSRHLFDRQADAPTRRGTISLSSRRGLPSPIPHVSGRRASRGASTSWSATSSAMAAACRRAASPRQSMGWRA